MADDKKDWLSWAGNARGHVSDFKERMRADREERAAAGSAHPAQRVILTRREVRAGKLDAGRILMTTLGGSPRPLTADDLKTFRENIKTAQKKLGAVRGIRAQQVLDLASSRPLLYVGDKGPHDAASDLDKARREILNAIPVSASNEEVRFFTPSGKDSRRARHVIIVKFLGWHEALGKLAAIPKGSKREVRELADWLRKEPLAFECDCERHRYFFRYVATIGGFNAGRREDGYPKIRNPGLRGVACKHVLRVMTEILHSPAVLNFLVRHLTRYLEVMEDPDLGRASTQLTQKEIQEQAKRAKSHRIRTSDQQKKASERQKKANALAAAKREKERKERQTRIHLKRVLKDAKPPAKRSRTAKAIEGMTSEQLKAFIAAMGLGNEAADWVAKNGK